LPSAAIALFLFREPFEKDSGARKARRGTREHLSCRVPHLLFVS
jgi:hypothetical protein